MTFHFSPENYTGFAMNVAGWQKKFQEHVFEKLRELGVSAFPPKLQLTSPPADLVKKVDLCIPCFQYSKELKKKPEEVAKLLSEKLTSSPFLDSVSITPDKPFINLRFNLETFGTAVVGETLLRAPSKTLAVPKTVLIEFSSPNTNKPQHLGHVRNNLLGDSVSRLHTFFGYNVTKINLINDRGIHICKSMLAYQLFGNNATPESTNIKSDHLVGDYYVLFERKFSKEFQDWLATDSAKERFEIWKTKEGKKEIEALRKPKEDKKAAKGAKAAETTTSKTAEEVHGEEWALFCSKYKELYFNNESVLGGAAREMLRKWEQEDAEVRKLWELMNGWVYDGFNKTYQDFGISFDEIDKESRTYLLGKKMCDENLAKGILEKFENGAVGIDLKKIGLKGETGKKVLLRNDGTSVYMTQDLGTAVDRFERNEKKGNQVDKLIYVVASEQNYHFQVLFKILEFLNSDYKGKLFHLSYGMVELPTGRMKSREGTVVDADDLLAETARLAFETTKEKWAAKSKEFSEHELAHRAQVISLACIRWFILRINPKTTVLYDPKKALDFSGNTGSYMLYTYARTRSILQKAGFGQLALEYDLEQEQDANQKILPWCPQVFKTLHTDEERQVLLSLYQLPEEAQQACDNYDPSKLAEATYQVAQRFNELYFDKNKHQIVNCTDPALKHARCLLTLAVGAAIHKHLQLLGITTLEQM